MVLTPFKRLLRISLLNGYLQRENEKDIQPPPPNTAAFGTFETPAVLGKLRYILGGYNLEKAYVSGGSTNLITIKLKRCVGLTVRDKTFYNTY